MNVFAQDNSFDPAAAVRWQTATADATAQQDASAKDPGNVRPSISRHELADMTAQLAIMCRSGVDVTTALKSLARQSRRPGVSRVINDVYDSVMGGATLSNALHEHERIFGPTYIATVAAGEASGKMSQVLAELAQLQRSELRLSRTIKALMAYPVLLASVSSLVIVALILLVLPQFANIFEQYDTPLPLITRMLIGFAQELQYRWWLYLPLAGLGVMGLFSLRFSPQGRRALDWVLIHAWLLRDVSRTLLVGRACRLVGLMAESGVPLLECLRLTQRAIGNSYYRDLFDQLEEEVLNGRGLAQTLSGSEIVPPSAAEMIATAERAGNIGEVTRMVGEHFEEEGEARLRQVVAVMEPIITVGMGVVVAVVVLAVMMPMFDLATFTQ